MHLKKFTGIVVALSCVTLLRSQQEPSAPADVVRLISRADAELRKTWDVAKILQPGWKELVALMKRDPRAPKSWQLDPALAQKLADQQLFDFVVARATSTLICGAELLSRYHIEELNEESIAKSKVRETYWGPTRAERVHISPDCGVLTDAQGKPITLRTEQDFASFWQLQKGFNTKAQGMAAERNVGRTDLFQKNLTYLKREHYSWQPNVPDSVRTVLELPEGVTVSSTQLLNLIALVEHSRTEPKLIFVAPFSW